MEVQTLYLKNNKYGLQVVKYNSKTLSRICVYKGLECNIETYDDMEDFNWNVKRDMVNSFELATVSEFQEMIKEFENNLKYKL